jgi:ParB family transcriptional regulator, chromosome partitioning protein
MRMPWSKPKPDQLELLDADSDAACGDERMSAPHDRTARSSPAATRSAKVSDGHPLVVPADRIDEDPNNPRTEFPDAELDELADDIRQRGVLQPLVVHPADALGRYRLHFGAKRLRAALRAGLREVPVVVRDAPADAYDQVAENQKRHALTPLDLAHFIQGRVDAGDSNADIARRLGMNLTTVAHHLSLLNMPPVLDQALASGRCTSPRTLHELSKLHETEPDKVRALVDSDAPITRAAVEQIKAANVAPTTPSKSGKQTDAIARAHVACDRLERALARVDRPAPFTVALPDLVALRIRVEDIGRKWPWGSDRQTPGAPSN